MISQDINFYFIMGICNTGGNSTDRQTQVSTKAILKTNSFDNMQFYFTTQNLLRVDADCLVLFCDEKMNLHKNTFVANVGKFETRKIKQFADAHMLSTKARIFPGQIIFFPISISTLQFRFIGMVCLRPWDGHQRIEPNLSPVVRNLFSQLNRHHVSSLAITQFNDQFGIPVQEGCNMIASALYENKAWLKVVTIICNNATSQGYYMQKIAQYHKFINPNAPDAPQLSYKSSQGSSVYY